MGSVAAGHDVDLTASSSAPTVGLSTGLSASPRDRASNEENAILELRVQEFTPQYTDPSSLTGHIIFSVICIKCLPLISFRPPTVSVLISRSISFGSTRECPMDTNWTYASVHDHLLYFSFGFAGYTFDSPYHMASVSLGIKFKIA